ncbi:unnamed protein product [Pieris macdunnoughi]|uniref:Myrosinase 1 n=1 Tax=Pieris macdunnoughi TaxID=345717 RepID=A0A821PX03_9NEOP|nr:unnamed protein product [Pieris macdunnoughi]
MTRLSLLLLTFCIAVAHSKLSKRHEVRKFPEGFLFGTATASYQVEGAWNIDGKSENIWDHLTHTKPCVISDCSNGDIADDSYHLYKRDVEMMRELGLDYYRFSLSWTRILPNSFPDVINQAGIDYYNNLINELLKHNIEPMITLYHWDLPQKLQTIGGWANPNIVNWFADFARVAFDHFGDRVKYWITINEPYQICNDGYGDDAMAPMLNMKGVAEYMCSKNLLMAHATAYHIYDKEYRDKWNGIVFVGYSALWFEPESEEHVQAANDTNDFMWGQYVHPIFSETGGYPQAMKERIAAKSAQQGYPRSRLIDFSPEEIEFVKGSADAFGLNHYMTLMVYRNESVDTMFDSPSFSDDTGTAVYTLPEVQIGESQKVLSVPWGFYNLLTAIRERYGNPPIYITENGYGSDPGLDDNHRVYYYREYLSAMLDAMEEGSDVRAYTAWSLLDNFEWKYGYTRRFGLYEVDYNSPDRTRTPRKSAYVYKEILRTRSLDHHYEPDMSARLTIDEGH